MINIKNRLFLALSVIFLVIALGVFLILKWNFSDKLLNNELSPIGSRRATSQFLVHSQRIAGFNFEVHFKNCQNPECTSVTDAVIDNTSSTVFGIDVIKHSNGLPFIVYESNQDLKVSKCNDINCFSKTNYIMEHNSIPFQISMVLGDDGNPIISYNTYTPQSDIFVIHCLDQFCMQHEKNLIDSINTTGFAYGIGLDPNIGIAGNGLPVISYWDSEEGSIAFAYCQDVACISSNHFSFDTGHNALRGESQDLAIRDDGNPLIVYSSESYGGAGWPNEIRVAACKDFECANLEINSIAGPFFNSNEAISVDIGSDGNPLVIYRGDNGADGNFNVYAAKCIDPLCSLPTSGNEISGNLITESAISIGEIDGRPLVATVSKNQTSEWINTFHCSDISCGQIIEANHVSFSGGTIIPISLGS